MKGDTGAPWSEIGDRGRNMLLSKAPPDEICADDSASILAWTEASRIR